MIKPRIVLPLSLAFAVSTTAWAGSHGDSGDNPMFKTLDKDGNGRITQQEAQAHEPLASQFESIDTDGDGAVTREELENSRKAESGN